MYNQLKKWGATPSILFIRTHNKALYYDVRVFMDVYKLRLLIYSLNKDFSYDYKYTLGPGIKRFALQLVSRIYRKNKGLNNKFKVYITRTRSVN
jgi:hypothetical protein